MASCLIQICLLYYMPPEVMLIRRKCVHRLEGVDESFRAKPSESRRIAGQSPAQLHHHQKQLLFSPVVLSELIVRNSIRLCSGTIFRLAEMKAMTG